MDEAIQVTHPLQNHMILPLQLDWNSSWHLEDWVWMSKIWISLAVLWWLSHELPVVVLLDHGCSPHTQSKPCLFHDVCTPKKSDPPGTSLSNAKMRLTPDSKAEAGLATCDAGCDAGRDAMRCAAVQIFWVLIMDLWRCLEYVECSICIYIPKDRERERFLDVSWTSSWFLPGTIFWRLPAIQVFSSGLCRTSKPVTAFTKST